MNQTAKNEHGDQPESTAVSNGTTSYDDWEAMQEAWRVRMVELAEEMASYGFAAVFNAISYDPLEKQAEGLFVRRGNYYTVLGMLHEGIHEMQNPTE